MFYLYGHRWSCNKKQGWFYMCQFFVHMIVQYYPYQLHLNLFPWYQIKILTCDVEKTSSSGKDLFGCFGKLICEGIPHQNMCDNSLVGGDSCFLQMVPFLRDAFVQADIDSKVWPCGHPFRPFGHCHHCGSERETGQQIPLWVGIVMSLFGPFFLLSWMIFCFDVLWWINPFFLSCDCKMQDIFCNII